MNYLACCVLSPDEAGGVLVSVEALIIDDSPVARRIIRHHLEQIGCKVVGEAENGFQGLNLFRELKPDLVTLDLIMPTFQGIDASEVFRTSRSLAGLDRRSSRVDGDTGNCLNHWGGISFVQCSRRPRG